MKMLLIIYVYAIANYLAAYFVPTIDDTGFSRHYNVR